MGGIGAICEGRRYRIRGLVQGVGFRPFVWRLAHEEGIAGFVLNDGDGVLMEAHAGVQALSRLERRISAEAPPLSRIDRIESHPIESPAPDGFSIRESRIGGVSTGIVADAAACADCLGEVLDPASRRAGYAFTNCTHCGPRLSIVRAIPYDRANTSMAAFPMCPDCAREYADPADRRFHAEPIACPVCGPKLWLEGERGARLAGDPLSEAAALIKLGRVVAVKGVGGFHLACDALNHEAVARLRDRKRRDAKPLAVMVRDLAMARKIAHVSLADEALLAGPAAPIVLLATRDEGLILAPLIAPGHRRIGLMLPSTPLHHLLLRAANRPLVMTSGNVSSEPQCTVNEDARIRLATIADAWLMHDRDIASRLDDSVVRVDASGPTILRRARGLAPEPLTLGAGFSGAPATLALGGELKATFCFLRDGAATLSQHIGDLQDARTRDEYRAALDLYRSLFQVASRVVAVDLHPDYASTRLGEVVAGETGAQLVRVQHHHAHLAACLAENGVTAHDDELEPTLGIVLDGTGLGTDGTIWGGELLLGGYRSFERVGHLVPVPLPGGERAVREPWRNTYAHLARALEPDGCREQAGLPLVGFLNGKPLAVLDGMMARGINTPLASSAGRLFDAVAGAIGVCRERQSYEGQTGMMLEALAEPLFGVERGYPFALSNDDGRLVIDPAPMWQALIADLRKGASAEQISARFHAGLIDALAEATRRIAQTHAVHRVALSGGVFANRILLEGLAGRLSEFGFNVLLHHQVPANDGGLALGQACIAAARLAGTNTMEPDL